MLNNINAYTLDWSPMKVEGFKEAENEAIMVFNFDITTGEKIKNVVQYVVGRAIWGPKNLPPKAKIILSFDIRGQNIVMTGSASFKNQLLVLLDKLKIENQISIEFLR